jgi:hypothetical protein
MPIAKLTAISYNEVKSIHFERRKTNGKETGAD